MLIVCTSRLELLETRPGWGAGKQNATALTLAPLAPDDANELVNALLGRVGPLDAFGRRVLERAEGNPFFVEEILAMLIERGALVRRNGDWHASDELPEFPLPDSVHGVIAARLDLLDHDAREALRNSSVVGRVFWPAAVGAREDAIAPLVVRGLVSEAQSSIAGMRQFEFKHALTRDVAYASLRRADRRTLHRRVAEWIQQVVPDRGLEAAELAAHHYGEAVASGEDDPAVVQRAAELSLTAGEGALRRGALDSATRHLERALQLAPAGDVRAAALIGLAELALLRGAGVGPSLAEAEQRLEAAIGLLTPGAVELRSQALAWQSRIHWLSGRWEAAIDAADGAVAALRGLPESPQLARALARRSQLAMLRDSRDAHALSREALDVASRVGDQFAVVNASINLSSVEALDGTPPDPDGTLALISTAREIGANEEAYRALVNFVWSACGFVPIDEVLELAAAGEAVLAGTPRPGGLGDYLPLSIAYMHLLPAGRFADADSTLADVDTGDLIVTSRMLWLGARAQLLLRRGELAPVGKLVDELHVLAVESGESQRIIPMACAYLPWSLLAGDREAMRSVANEALELVRDRWPVTISPLPALRALAAAAELDLVARFAESFRRTPRAPTAGRLGPALQTADALLATHDGDHDAAVAHLTAAAAAERALGYAFDAAATELDLADALEAARQPERAATLRTASTAFFASIGCANPI